MHIRQLINAIKARVLRSYILVLVVVLAFVIMVALSSYFMTNIVRNQLEYNAQTALDSLETDIKTDLKEPRTVLGNQSECVRNMILRNASEEDVNTYLSEITEYILSNEDKQLSGFGGIYGFFDVFGGVFLDGQEHRPLDNFIPEEHPWYTEGADAGGEIVFLHPHAGVMSTLVVITYARGIFDDKGKLLGVIALDMNLDRIKEYIINANRGKIWWGVLLNEDYEYIFHIDPRLVGTKFEDMNSDTAAVMAELRLGHDISEFRMRNYENVPSITFIRKLENGWSLGIVTPEEEYFREVTKVRLILISLGTVLAVILSVILVRIITEKQKADAKINEAEKAIMANRVKSDFLAKMSHEIRSPMNVILGITEMQLEKEGLPPDTVEALDRMQNSGYLLLNIINDILDLSKIESGKMELNPVNYDVASVINDTVQFNIMRFETKPILFSLKVDENVPETLFGDDLRIKQILNNVLSNAFKYTEAGEVVLSISAEMIGPDNPVALIFRISDTGRGMSQDQIKKLFEDYARFNVEANRKIEGTGLGMGITKRFIEMMNGDITVESEPEKGSVFTLRILQGYVNSEVLGKEGINNLQQLHIEKEARQNRMPQIIREYMPYGKVLVVDDMEPNLYVAKGLLSPYELSIDTAMSGRQAVEKIKSGMVFDVIFMDHFMPDMDGIETTKIIRSLGYKRPIIALTANALVGQAEVFLANGFDGFISKPIDTRQINSTLNRLIRDKYPIETVEAARQLKKKLEKEAESKPPDLSRLRALVVDDFLPNLNVTEGILDEYKMQTDCVLSGREAIDRIKSGEPRYDIIFMDLMMPEMDGMEATRFIRSLGTEYAANIPIVALTALITSGTAEQEKMLLDKGFQAVLYKPLSLAKVDAFINDWINDKIKNCTITSDKKEKSMEIDIPGISEEKVMALYNGKLKIFLPVLRSYLSVVPETLKKMSQVTEETLPQYNISVHGLKSVSDSIGAEEARKMALELEMLSRDGDISGVLAKNGALIKYVKELLDNIQKWLSRLDAQG